MESLIHEASDSGAARIVLATANARYHHASLALRYLLANLGPLVGDARIMEFHISQRPADAAEAILSARPEIVALAVYVWNARFTEELAGILKAASPSTKIVLGGPEVSFPDDPSPVSALADCTIAGEGEEILPGILRRLLDGEEVPAVAVADEADLAGISLPYRLYTDEDIAHRTIYVETTRGCPMGCEFCLSSLDRGVRRFPVDPLLAELDRLWERGARKLKFVDRALNFGVSDRVLDWLAARSGEGIFAHFELVPQRIPERLLGFLKRFPDGAVQLEAGVQSLDPEVTALIGRRQDPDEVLSTISRLLKETGCHIHADLVVGLPGQSPETFAADFDRLLATGVHEIQVGILKRLRGAPIARHEKTRAMAFNPSPPYEILRTDLIPYRRMQELKRFAAYFDRVRNSGRFPRASALLLDGPSPHALFAAFCGRAHETFGATHGISPTRMAGCLRAHLVEDRGIDGSLVDAALEEDLARTRRRKGEDALPARQRRHSRAKETR